MVADKPPVDEVIKMFYEFVGDSILIGHNIKSSDLRYITKAANKAGVNFKVPFLDTYLLAKKNEIDDPTVFTKIAKLKFKTIEDFVEERYGAKIAFENEDEIFISIGMKAGKQNGGRGLLNVMETVIINPLSEFIFERSDMLRKRQIMIKPMFPDKPELCRFEFELK